MSAPTQPIIDPHIHLWDLLRTPREPSLLVKLLGRYPAAMKWVARHAFPRNVVEFFGKPDHLLANYLPEDYQRDLQGNQVEGFVHVEASWKARGPHGPVEETRWLEQLDSPRLKGIVGYADLLLGTDIDEVLQAHMEASPRFRGIRATLFSHPSRRVMSSCKRSDLTRDDRWREGFAVLTRRGLSFDATLYHHQLDELTGLATDFPESTIILCHAGTPVGYGGPFGGIRENVRERVLDTWQAAMTRLAECPGVFVKISGLVMPVVGRNYHDQPYPPSARQLADDLEPLISFIIATFGAERCMFASNFPVDKVSVSWATLYESFHLAVADRSQAEQAAMFSENARSVYRL